MRNVNKLILPSLSSSIKFSLLFRDFPNFPDFSRRITDFSEKSLFKMIAVAQSIKASSGVSSGVTVGVTSEVNLKSA